MPKIIFLNSFSMQYLIRSHLIYLVVNYLFESESESYSVLSDSSQSHGLYSLWNSPGQNTRMGSLSLLQGIFPTQGWNPSLPALQADSLPAEPQGKPKNTGVGSLSLLQGIFPTQKLNQGLLHCRWFLYQLIYQESPNYLFSLF